MSQIERRIHEYAGTLTNVMNRLVIINRKLDLITSSPYGHVYRVRRPSIR